MDEYTNRRYSAICIENYSLDGGRKVPLEVHYEDASVMGRGYFIMHSHRQASFLKRSVALMTIVMMVMTTMMVMTIMMMMVMTIIMMMMKDSSTAWLVPVAGLGWSKNSSAATPLMDRSSPDTIAMMMMMMIVMMIITMRVMVVVIMVMIFICTNVNFIETKKPSFLKMDKWLL